MKHRSKFLVIVDDSEELNVAIRFAAKRAQSTKGGVILLNVIGRGIITSGPTEFSAKTTLLASANS